MKILELESNHLILILKFPNQNQMILSCDFKQLESFEKRLSLKINSSDHNASRNALVIEQPPCLKTRVTAKSRTSTNRDRNLQGNLRKVNSKCEFKSFSTTDGNVMRIRNCLVDRRLSFWIVVIRDLQRVKFSTRTRPERNF